MPSSDNDIFLQGQPLTYYGVMRMDLRSLANLEKEWVPRARQECYDHIREKSGLPFDDYGDEPERWLAWMEANDTMNWKAASQLRDERRRQRGLPPIFP